RPLLCGFARGDDFRTRADADVRELRFGDDLGGHCLRVLGNRLGVVDLDEHGSRGDVLPAYNGNLSDAPIDPRRDVEPRRVDLPLRQAADRAAPDTRSTSLR